MWATLEKIKTLNCLRIVGCTMFLPQEINWQGAGEYHLVNKWTRKPILGGLDPYEGRWEIGEHRVGWYNISVRKRRKFIGLPPYRAHELFTCLTEVTL